jgi:hypothetical protein
VAQYKVKVHYRNFDSEQVFPTLSGAMLEANKTKNTDKDARSILVLRDSEGQDHPDNVGVFLLHRIVK